MKRFSARQRLLGGALLVAGAILAVDRVTQSSGPAAAQAQPGVAQIATAPPAWHEVEQQLARLTEQSYASVAGELARLERDLFLPTPTIDAAYGALEEQQEVQEPESVVDPAEEFRTRHRLVGVVLGSLPLATIDDRVLPLGAELDGYRLVRIQRDQVIFVEPQTQAQIVLVIESRPGNNPGGER